MEIKTKFYLPKKLKRFLLQSLFLLLAIAAKAQTTQLPAYPQNFFRNPLGIPLQLAANFGELRNNHFHMGLDIRTNQRENLTVYAAADGFISRIKIEQYGFGRAIYVTHANGFTSVYAHLNNFYPALNAYIKNIQYSSESWEQDVYLNATLFPVTKGQFIANSGNTGGSAGPHLHFEIRETYTENNLNPLLFNFNVADKIPPAFSKLFMYDRRLSTYQQTPKNIAIKKTGNFYTTAPKVINISSPIISFGISATDKATASFALGIYQADLWLDNVLQTGFNLDNFGYADSRYINAATDYTTKAKGGPWIQHVSKLPGNNSPVFTGRAEDGVVHIPDTLIHEVTIIIKDVAANSSTLRFKIKLAPAKTRFYANTAAYVMVPNQPNSLKANNVEAYFTKNAFYDTVQFLYSSKPSANANAVSLTHSLHNYTVPVHDSFALRLKATRFLSAEQKNKVVIKLTSNRKTEALKATWNNDWAEAKFRDLGDFELLIDTLPPTLTPLGFANGANLKSRPSLSFLANDNLGELQRFRAELDGKWLMFSRKNDYFIHSFDERTTSGTHTLVVKAVDQVGNTTEKTFIFSR